MGSSLSGGDCIRDEINGTDVDTRVAICVYLCTVLRCADGGGSGGVRVILYYFIEKLLNLGVH